MRRAWCLLLLLGGMMAGLPVGKAATLADFAWKRRLVVAFAPDERGLVAQQRAVFAAAADAMAERDLVLVEVVGERAGAGLDAQELRARFGVAGAESVAILVGKDGGAKLRQGAAIPAAVLCRTVDAMPMRRQELAGRG